MRLPILEGRLFGIRIFDGGWREYYTVTTWYDDGSVETKEEPGKIVCLPVSIYV